MQINNAILLRAGLLATTVMVAPALARAQSNTLIEGNDGTLPLPTGQFVTPVTPLTNAIQQPLNPNLPNYPNFVAGEAVRSQLSPDGTTLAIICAGQNTLTHPPASWTRRTPRNTFFYTI